MTSRRGASIVPRRLKKGDLARVVAPSRSLGIIGAETRAIADGRVAAMGLRLSFAARAGGMDDFLSTSIADRVADLHEAFEDPEVALVWSVIGGFNVNQLLRSLDYRRIERNPKVLCGYSDFTALELAILAKTGLATYSGPHYATFGMKKGVEYVQEEFERRLFRGGRRKVPASSRWSDDAWYLDQDHRTFHRNRGPWTIQPGRAEGRVWGGNLGTINLLQGTEFLPDLDGALLFVEDCTPGSEPVWFDRNLQSLLHQPGAQGIEGLCIGRFQPASKMTAELLRQIVKSKPELEGVPVVADLDFGHTYPMFTFPQGGYGWLDARGEDPRLTLDDRSA